ncbi:hypothetical protein GCM10009066_17370 [Halarchaeum salinum]|uniref:Uncharacterized protein n=1 Tax=Halarchaeum salinum TaxID=489912 RepID=A0AAV3S7Y2_9EURY
MKGRIAARPVDERDGDGERLIQPVRRGERPARFTRGHRSRESEPDRRVPVVRDAEVRRSVDAGDRERGDGADGGDGDEPDENGNKNDGADARPAAAAASTRCP